MRCFTQNQIFLYYIHNMSDISPTLLCKQIVDERIQNKEAVYNFGLGENPITQPSYFIDSVKCRSRKIIYFV